MSIAHVMTAGFNVIFLALKPVERWKAAGRLGTSMTEPWFILTGVAVIVVLAGLLLMISLRRIARERKISGQLFFDYAEKRGLSGRERQILLEIAYRAGLKRSHSIFTMVSAFDHGAGKMIEESRARQGAEESQRLRTELSFLREKLGFQKQSSVSIGSPTKLKKPSSRQIPEGKKLYINRRSNPDFGDIESTIIKNDNMELTVRLTTSVESKLGEFWRAQYYFGTSVWEFDTSVVRCYGDILVFNHSDDMRFISRRRFLRIRVSKPAFIARFPFSRMLRPNSISNKEVSGAKQGSANSSANTWGPPEFIPARVTELGGPGLRVEAPLEVKTGDRVLVIVNLSEEKTQDSIPQQKNNSSPWVLEQNSKTTPSKIIEDIGEVRHVGAIEDGFSIAVELTGLSDSDINELIRAANAASINTNSNLQDTPNSVNTEENAPEAAALQGT